MQKYDVVLLLDAKLSDAERKSVLDEVETTLGKHIIQTDTMGLLGLEYNLHDKASQDSAYFVSYLVQAPSSEILAFKKQLVYNKAIKRYMVFAMHATQAFLIYADVVKELTDIIASWDEKKMGQKLIFLQDKRNAKYINWKAIPLLKKYITRFGNIKPRKYTGNAVGTQKKLREEILRARELGLLEYIKD